MQSQGRADAADPALAENRDPVAHQQRCAQRPLGIVFVSDGRTEHTHDSITHELFDEAAKAVDGAGHLLEQVALQRAYVLGIQALAERGEARQVGEQNGNGATIGLRIGERTGTRTRYWYRAHCDVGRRCRCQLGPAFGTERKIGRGFKPAGGTSHCNWLSSYLSCFRSASLTRLGQSSPGVTPRTRQYHTGLGISRGSVSLLLLRSRGRGHAVAWSRGPSGMRPRRRALARGDAARCIPFGVASVGQGRWNLLRPPRARGGAAPESMNCR